MKLRILFFLMIGLVVSTSERAHAADRWTLPLEDRNWRTAKIPGTLENDFRIDNGLLQVRSSNSASFRYFELPGALTHPTQLNWRWRVDSYSNLAHQSNKGRDDRPLAVHLWFDDTQGGSLFGQVGSVLGYPKVGHLLTYVWGAQEAKGSIVRNPYYAKGRVIVLVGQNAPTGEWGTVRRDIARDFQAAFGKTPDLSSLRYIAISADTDDLGGQSVGAVESLSILSP